MVQGAQPGGDPSRRNGAARKSLIASIVFLIPTVIILVSNGIVTSSWGTQFFKTNPNHPLVPFFGIIFEITFLFLPFTFLASLIVILIGARGIRFASRSKDGVGRSESKIGIGLSLLVMILCVAGAAQWTSAWKQ